MEHLPLDAYFGASLILAFGLIALVLRPAFKTWRDPSARIPGPKLNAWTSIPLSYATFNGDEAAAVGEWHKQYGPIVRLAPDLVSIIGDAPTWKQIYGFKAKNEPTFHKHMLWYETPVNGVPGPITSSDEINVRQRKTVMPAFSDQAIRQYEPRMKRWSSILQKKLAEAAESGIGVDLVVLLNCTTFDIISDLTMSEPLGMLENGGYVRWARNFFAFIKWATWLRAFKYLNARCGPLARVLVHYIPVVRGMVSYHHRHVKEHVDARLGKSPNQPDLWTFITGDSIAASQLSTEERYSMVNELLLAGTETTASALSAAIYYLSQNKQWMSKIQGELRERYHSLEDLSISSLQSEPILNAVLKEVLRLFPPLPVGLPRIVPKGGATVRDTYISAGTSVAVYHITTNTSEINFSKPMEFRPERWLDDPEFANDNLNAVEPFQVGPRNCLGKNFAWHEMRLLLSTILLQLDFELLPECHNWRDQKVFSTWHKPPLKVKVSIPEKAAV